MTSSRRRNKGAKATKQSAKRKKGCVINSGTKVGFDIKPESSIKGYVHCGSVGNTFDIADVAPVLGMQPSFIKRVIGARSTRLTECDLERLLELDAFQETFVPRSGILHYLMSHVKRQSDKAAQVLNPNCLCNGDAREQIARIKDQSIQCVVTSTPYWAMRVYDEMVTTEWADGEKCVFGLEQTPEGFIRHSVEILYRLYSKMKADGSVWWNIADSFNTRTQIRGNAVEALRAMQGCDKRKWSDHIYKRYSAGHSFLKDGEQCMIPYRIAERASRIGYYVKSVISWCKSSSMPEPQHSRVSRSVEHILHLTIQRTPKFKKDAYLLLAPEIGGRQSCESAKLSDSWLLPTSAGRDGHGAQFPLQLPGRCISLSTDEGDVVLDPFVGSGTSLLAAKKLNRKYLGIDVSKKYLALAAKRLKMKGRRHVH